MDPVPLGAFPISSEASLTRTLDQGWRASFGAMDARWQCLHGLLVCATLAAAIWSLARCAEDAALTGEVGFPLGTWRPVAVVGVALAACRAGFEVAFHGRMQAWFALPTFGRLRLIDAITAHPVDALRGTPIGVTKIDAVGQTPLVWCVVSGIVCAFAPMAPLVGLLPRPDGALVRVPLSSSDIPEIVSSVLGLGLLGLFLHVVFHLLPAAATGGGSSVRCAFRLVAKARRRCVLTTLMTVAIVLTPAIVLGLTLLPLVAAGSSARWPLATGTLTTLASHWVLSAALAPRLVGMRHHLHLDLLARCEGLDVEWEAELAERRSGEP